MAPSLRIDASATTHVGLVRSENQDRVASFSTPLGEAFAVADGMGGHLHGGLAAEIAVETLERRLGDAAPHAEPGETLSRAGAAANAAVRERSGRIGEAGRARPMGSTLVVVLVRGDHLWIGHAGDSPTFRLRDGRLERLTRNHTLVQRLVDDGLLSPEQAADHPDSHVLVRALGQSDELELEVQGPFDVAPGDRWLLCSDGLSEVVGDDRLVDALGGDGSAEDLARRLLATALEAGAPDNVSLQVLRIDEDSPGGDVGAGARAPAADPSAVPESPRPAPAASVTAAAPEAPPPQANGAPGEAPRDATPAPPAWIEPGLLLVLLVLAGSLLLLVCRSPLTVEPAPRGEKSWTPKRVPDAHEATPKNLGDPPANRLPTPREERLEGPGWWSIPGVDDDLFDAPPTPFDKRRPETEREPETLEDKIEGATDGREGLLERLEPRLD